MNFIEIHEQLGQAAISGHIYEIVMGFINTECVLDATTRTWADNWLYYAPKNAQESDSGCLKTFKELMDNEVGDYSCNYLNNSYSGTLPIGMTAFEFLSRNDSAEHYSSEQEFRASGEIYSAINNGTYTDMALNNIFLQRWPKKNI